MLSISSYNSAFAINLSRAVSKAVSTVHVGETGLNWGEKTLTLVFARSASLFCRLNSDFSEIETRWGVTLESDRSVHSHQSSLVDRQGSEKSQLRHAHARAASCRVNNSWQANSSVLTYLSCWSSNCTKSRSRYTPLSSVCRGKRTVQRKKIQVLP